MIDYFGTQKISQSFKTYLEYICSTYITQILLNLRKLYTFNLQNFLIINIVLCYNEDHFWLKVTITKSTISSSITGYVISLHYWQTIIEMAWLQCVSSASLLMCVWDICVLASGNWHKQGFLILDSSWIFHFPFAINPSAQIVDIV